MNLDCGIWFVFLTFLSTLSNILDRLDYVNKLTWHACINELRFIIEFQIMVMNLQVAFIGTYRVENKDHFCPDIQGFKILQVQVLKYK